MRRRLRKLRQQCTQRRRAAFFVLQHMPEPEEHFVDPAARLHDEILAALPPLPAHRARRFRDQLELWPSRMAPRDPLDAGVANEPAPVLAGIA